LRCHNDRYDHGHLVHRPSQLAVPRSLAPGKEMLRADLMPPRNLRHDCARCIRFRDDPSLILLAPPPPATDATANLDASARRGSVNYMVDHICEPILSTPFASSELRRPPQDGGKTPLTMPSRYVRNHRTRRDRLGNDPPLLLIAPSSAADRARYLRAAL